MGFRFPLKVLENIENFLREYEISSRIENSMVGTAGMMGIYYTHTLAGDSIHGPFLVAADLLCGYVIAEGALGFYKNEFQPLMTSFVKKFRPLEE